MSFFSVRARLDSSLVAVAIACSLAGSAPAARAQSTPAPDAEQLIAQGIQARRQHQDAAALDAFRRAYDLDKSGRTMAQIGLAEQALGRWLDSERDLGEALRAETDPWVGRHRDALVEALAEVSHHVGQLELESNVPGAELLVDDRSIGILPLKGVRLPAGKATLEVRAAGYAPTRFDIQVPPGTTVLQRVELSRLVSTAAPAPAAPPAPALTTAPEAGSLQRTTALVMLGSGGALIVGGVVAHVLREQALARFDDDRQCFYGTQTREERCGQDLHDADTAKTVMVLGYAVGGAAVGASVVLLLTAPRGQAPSSALTLRPSPGGATVSYAASF